MGAASLAGGSVSFSFSWPRACGATKHTATPSIRTTRHRVVNAIDGRFMGVRLQERVRVRLALCWWAEDETMDRLRQLAEVAGPRMRLQRGDRVGAELHLPLIAPVESLEKERGERRNLLRPLPKRGNPEL